MISKFSQLAGFSDVTKRLLPHVLIFLVVCLYVLAGALIFLYFEQTNAQIDENANESIIYDQKFDKNRSIENVDFFNQSEVAKIDKIEIKLCTVEDVEIILQALYFGCCFQTVHTGYSKLDSNTEPCYDTLKTELSECAANFQKKITGLSVQITELIKLSPATTAKTASQAVPSSQHQLKTWNLQSAIVLAFTIVTTIGYGHVVPRTYGGRVFCVFYGFLGIPLTLLAIADHGRFLSAGLQKFCSKIGRYLKAFVSKLKFSRKIKGQDFTDPVFGKNDEHDTDDEEEGDDDDDDDKTLSPLVLLVTYVVYLTAGAGLLSDWEEGWTFTDAIYFNFVSLTTIGFGDVVPTNSAKLPLVLAYVGVGLALSSSAVDILAEYLRKLHEFGKIITHAAGAKVWLGGKVLTVRELVQSMGKYLGASDDAVKQLMKNLDTVVNQVIVQKDLGLPINDILFEEPPSRQPDEIPLQPTTFEPSADDPTHERSLQEDSSTKVFDSDAKFVDD